MREPKLNSHVGGADLQRHEHVGEAGEQRRREHQQHDRAVHGEELVVLLLGLHHVQPGLEELGADDERHHAAEAEVEERRDQVQVPDRLVVGGGDPVDHDVAAAVGLAGAVEDLRLTGGDRGGTIQGRCHVLLPYSSDDSVVAGSSVPGRFWRRS
jgi:hypothetical protein